MTKRVSTANLLGSLAALWLFMLLLPVALAGFGIGVVELVVWVLAVVAGTVLLVRRHRAARLAA